MGRSSQGVATVDRANCIDIDELKRKGLLQKDKCVLCSLSWSDGNEIGIESNMTNDNSYIRMHYLFNDEVLEYDIQLDSVPSNLGKGRVLYFLCPETGKRCRKLYRTYGSRIWKSRESYSKRIYYRSQICSKYDYYNSRYWHYERTLIPQLLSRCKNSTYKGKPTKAILKYYNALDKMNYFDNKRLIVASRFIERLKPVLAFL